MKVYSCPWSASSALIECHLTILKYIIRILRMKAGMGWREGEWLNVFDRASTAGSSEKKITITCVTAIQCFNRFSISCRLSSVITYLENKLWILTTWSLYGEEPSHTERYSQFEERRRPGQCKQAFATHHLDNAQQLLGLPLVSICVGRVHDTELQLVLGKHDPHNMLSSPS